MTGLPAAEIEARALDIVDAPERPRRRPNVRVAPALRTIAPTMIDTPSGPIVAWRAGEGPAALLVHGSRDDNSLWSPLIEALLARDYAVVAVDMPGHGQSPAQEYGVRPWLHALLAVQAQLGPVDAIVAHSMGALAAIATIEQGLRVRSAVLIGTPLPGRPELGLLSPRLAEAKREAPEVFARALAILNERSRRNADVDGFDPEAAVRGFEARGLLVHCRDDEVWRAEAAEYLAAAWPGAELLLTEALGHRKVARAREVVRRIADFVAADR